MTHRASNPSQTLCPKSSTSILLLWLFCCCFLFSFYFLEYTVTKRPGFKSQLSPLIVCCNSPKPRAESATQRNTNLFDPNFPTINLLPKNSLHEGKKKKKGEGVSLTSISGETASATSQRQCLKMYLQVTDVAFSAVTRHRKSTESRCVSATYYTV